jgi:hypothetical protein
LTLAVLLTILSGLLVLLIRPLATATLLTARSALALAALVLFFSVRHLRICDPGTIPITQATV